MGKKKSYSLESCFHINKKKYVRFTAHIQTQKNELNIMFVKNIISCDCKKNV